MDAYLTNNEVNYIKQMVPEKKTIKLVNSFEEVKGKAYFFDQKEYIYKLMNDLKNGEKVVLASNSKIFLEKKILPEIKKMEDIKYLLLTSETEIKNSSTWGEYDLLMYTPTIVAGVSFEEKHFTKRYAYFSPMSSPANMCCQQLFRVRDTTDKNIYLYVKGGSSERCYKYSETRECVEKDLNDYINIENKILRKTLKKNINNGWIKTDIINRTFIKDIYYELLVNYYIKINKSKNNLKHEILKYLSFQGYFECKYINNDVSESDDFEMFIDEYNATVKEYAKDCTAETIELYRTIEAPTPEEYGKIKDKERKTKSEKIELIIYELNNKGIDIKTKTDWQILKIISNIRAINFDYNFENNEEKDIKKYIIEKIKYHSKNTTDKISKNNELAQIKLMGGDDEDDKENLNYTIHNQSTRDYWIMCFHCVKLIDIFGFSGRDDFCNRVYFTEETSKGLHFYINKYWDHFALLFRICKKKKLISQFNENAVLFSLNSKIKLINRKIIKIRTGRKKIKSYILVRLVNA